MELALTRPAPGISPRRQGESSMLVEIFRHTPHPQRTQKRAYSSENSVVSTRNFGILGLFLGIFVFPTAITPFILYSFRTFALENGKKTDKVQPTFAHDVLNQPFL